MPVILTRPDRVSCVQLALLGTEDGLYSLALSERGRAERRIKVDSFPPVLMMKQVPELDQLTFICGESRQAVADYCRCSAQ